MFIIPFCQLSMQSFGGLQCCVLCLLDFCRGRDAHIIARACMLLAHKGGGGVVSAGEAPPPDPSTPPLTPQLPKAELPPKHIDKEMIL